MRVKIAVLAAASMLVLAGCDDDASVVRHNIDTAADQFEVNRRIVFLNGITDEYMLQIEGRCAYEPEDNQVVVLCKVDEGSGSGSYKKHSLVRSDNVTVVVEQLDGADVSAYHHRVIFKPQTIVPVIDLETSLEDD